MEHMVYRALATQEGAFWVIRIHGLPDGLLSTTQALSDCGPDGIEAMTRDFIACLLDVEPDSFGLTVVKQITDPGLAEVLAQGIAQAERGETHDLGDFRQYLESED